MRGVETPKGIEPDFRRPASRLPPREDVRRRIRPYPIYWGEAPEPLLIAKDWLRHHALALGAHTGESGPAIRLWRATLGARLLSDIRQAGLLFVHIPKTAGTSISGLLYGRNLTHFTLAQYERRLGTAIGEVVSFSVVRQPIERFVSAFGFHRAGGTDVVLADRYERARIPHLDDIERLIDFLHEDPRRVACASAFLPQVGFLQTASGGLGADALFAMDGRAQEPLGLSAWLGRGPLPRLNVSERSPITLGVASKRKLAELYQGDFDLFETALAQSLARVAGRPPR